MKHLKHVPKPDFCDFCAGLEFLERAMAGAHAEALAKRMCQVELKCTPSPTQGSYWLVKIHGHNLCCFRTHDPVERRFLHSGPHLCSKIPLVVGESTHIESYLPSHFTQSLLCELRESVTDVNEAEPPGALAEFTEVLTPEVANEDFDLDTLSCTPELCHAYTISGSLLSDEHAVNCIEIGSKLSVLTFCYSLRVAAVEP
mmetsp:Transcript_29884/g.54169  ORF Transcript_29884/g.54169 Transcript_29884/m.54169 type:complete len:200 (-) Transcript_29884:717-1316(-)